MKRRLVALVALLALVLPFTPAHAGVRIERTVEGFFLLPERGGRTPAIYIHATEIDGARGFFIIYRASCANPTDYETCVVSSDKIISRYVRAGEVLEIDAQLASAHFRISHRGVTHEVRWKATRDAAPWDSGYECGGVPGSYVGIERDASAQGRLLGHRVEGSSGQPGDVALRAAAYRC